MDASTRRTVLDYHQRTKHHLDRDAAGPGTPDWDAQPDPFRHWTGAQTLALPRGLPEIGVAWNALPDQRPAAPLDIDSLGTLLRLSVGITAWKEYAGSRWALRAHPSSGNLHPTETYVIAAGVAGIPDGLHHHQIRTHALEQRASHGSPLPQAGDSPLPPAGEGPGERAGLWLGFSSIHWREAGSTASAPSATARSTSATCSQPSATRRACSAGARSCCKAANRTSMQMLRGKQKPPQVA